MLKITFRGWSLWSGRTARMVYIKINKDGSWSKYSERDLLSAFKETKGIEVEAVDKINPCVAEEG